MTRRTILALMFVVAPLAAQQPPLPPLPPMAPVAPLPPLAPLAPIAPAVPLPVLAPITPFFSGFDGRLDMSSRMADQQERIAERAADMASRASEMASQRALANLDNLNLTFDRSFENFRGFAGEDFDRSLLNRMPRQGWAQSDPADSLYRQARDQLNRGDYRKAAAQFKEIPVKFPNSVYAADALYYQAFSLYRIGGTVEMQEALSVLEAQRAKYASARLQGDPSGLAARIAAGLSTRGLGNDERVKRALAAGGNVCDREEQSVQAEALSALTQTDPDAAQQLTRKILARKDECSVSLRKSAVFLVGNKKDQAATTVLISVAKNDPSVDVRTDAINWLARQPGDDALTALEELSRSDDERVQRSAVRALATHPNARAHAGIRALVEKNETPEALRLAALDAFDRDRTTVEDANWLRATYFKTTNTRVKSRIASIVSNLGGEQNEKFMLDLIKNEDEPVESRSSALRRAGSTMEINSLAKFYDATSQRRLRETIISILGDRKEPEATDKLIDIVKNGTDPNLRTYAISSLTRKKDPRTTKLLLEIIDK